MAIDATQSMPSVTTLWSSLLMASAPTDVELAFVVETKDTCSTALDLIGVGGTVVAHTLK